MIRRAIRRSRRDRRGTTAVEFAMTASTLLLFVLGILQGGIMYWKWQALQGAAIDAARCAAINSTSCPNVSSSVAATQSYAVTAAQTRGLSNITTSNVVVHVGSGSVLGCGSTGSVEVVSVQMNYSAGTIIFYNLFPNLSVTACFPLAS